MKKQIIENAINEFRLAQTKPRTRPRTETSGKIHLLPTLPLPNGRQLHATSELLLEVSNYAALWIENNPDLKVRLKTSEFVRIVHQAFGESFAVVDLDSSTQDILYNVQLRIDNEIKRKVEQNGERQEVVLGCEVLRTIEVYPIDIGPVRFQSRMQWCDRAYENGEISEVCARRLKKAWNGSSNLRSRKESLDSMKEEDILNAIGSSSTVCTVICDGLSLKMLNEKSILAARLAMSALSLIWRRPSEGLQWMNLLYDGEIYHRHYVLFGEKGRYGSSNSISQLPGGVWTSEDFPELIKDYAGTLGILGEVLHTYVQPSHAVARPSVLNALFLSLLWFHEGCREPSDQIATTKFSASMDALAGGKRMNGIVKLIGARIGRQPNQKLMADGRTTKNVVKDVYNSGRSKLIHGSSENYAHDWTKSRGTAEVVARDCLVEVTKWLSENPDAVRIEQASAV